MLKYLIFEHPPTHPLKISKVSLCHYTYIWMVHGVGGGGVVSWRVHGVGGWCGGGGVVGGFIGWVHILTHP